MEILKVQNLCKTYGKGEAKVDALKNVSFSLNKGEFAAVVGESGSGKSTLLNCIGALRICCLRNDTTRSADPDYPFDCP